MRLCTLLLFLVPVFAQQPPEAPGPEKKHPAPTNLKLLPAENLMPTMQAFKVALGVKCEFCHNVPDFASDDHPHKEMARKMIILAREVNAKFPDGKMHVTCYTCHRGAEEPATKPPEDSPAPKLDVPKLAPK
jgi:hypothetical protein